MNPSWSEGGATGEKLHNMEIRLLFACFGARRRCWAEIASSTPPQQTTSHLAKPATIRIRLPGPMPICHLSWTFKESSSLTPVSSLEQALAHHESDAPQPCTASWAAFVSFCTTPDAPEGKNRPLSRSVLSCALFRSLSRPIPSSLLEPILSRRAGPILSPLLRILPVATFHIRQSPEPPQIVDTDPP